MTSSIICIMQNHLYQQWWCILPFIIWLLISLAHDFCWERVWLTVLHRISSHYHSSVLAWKMLWIEKPSHHKTSLHSMISSQTIFRMFARFTPDWVMWSIILGRVHWGVRKWGRKKKKRRRRRTRRQYKEC